MQQLMNDIGISTDAQIIEKILGGEPALFEVLIRRHNSVLYKIARSYGFNHQDAEDIMQDVHVSAYTGRSKFEQRASYRTWISRIAVNRCLYKLKYGHHKNEMPAGEISEGASPMQLPSMDTEPDALLMNRELAMVVEKSLQKIPVLYRTVFVLRAIEGFSVAETAELLEISATNVKVRLSRAKNLLQKEIEQVYSHAELYAFNLVYCDAMVQRVMKQVAEISSRGI